MRVIFCLTLLILQTVSLVAETEKYRCMWQTDPSTTMVIGWNQKSGHSPKLYLDTLDRAEMFDSLYLSEHLPDRKVRYKRMDNHFVRLENLSPNTVYYFRIKDSDGASMTMSFRTLPNDGSPLSIIAGGDSRNHRKNRQKANEMVAKLRPHLVMFGGDMTGSDRSSSWKSWLDDWQLTITEDGRLTPIIATRGNHERNNAVIYNLFDTPNKNVYYAMNLGGDMARAYTLNSLVAPGGKQRDWLETDLDENQDVRWKLAQYHHPIRPHHSRKSEKRSQQTYWAPLFDEYEMDLVIESDAHVVKTTYPIRLSKEKGSVEGFIRDDERGTVYIGEGCWGAPLRRNNDDKSWTRASGSFNQFKWIWMDMDKVEIRTIKTHNPNEINALTDESRFSLPTSLDIWNPPSGDVVVIGNAAPFDNSSTDSENNTPLLAKAIPPTDERWNKLVVVAFFTFLILLMLLPMIPNLKEKILFKKGKEFV